MVSSKRRLTALCALLATLSATTALAQTTADLQWSAGSQTIARPSYAPTGNYVLLPSETDLKVYHSTTGKIIASVGLVSNASTFSADSTKVYAAVGNTVVSFRSTVGDQVTTVLTVADTITQVAASPDKIHLAYTAETGGTYRLASYNLTTSTEDWSVALTGPVGDLQWNSDGSKIVLDGPKVFNAATGALLVDHNEMKGRFNLERLTVVYGLTNEATPRLQARNLSDGSLIWTASVVPQNYTGGGVAYTDRLFVPGRTADGKAAVWAYRFSDGYSLGVVNPSVRTEVSASPSNDPIVIVKPPVLRKASIVQVLDRSSVPYGIAEQFTITANSNTFTRTQDFSTMSKGATAIAGSRANGSGGYPVTVTVGPETSANAAYTGLVVRNALTGAVVAVNRDLTVISGLKQSVAVSKNGTYIVVMGWSSASAPTNYDTWLLDKNGAILSRVPTGGNGQSVAFSDDTNFVVSTDANKVERYTVSGGAASLVGSFNAPSSEVIAVNGDGSIVYTKSNATKALRTIVASGTQDLVAVVPTGGQLKYLGFDKDNYIYIGYLASANTLQLKRYYGGAGTLTLNKTYTKTYAAPIFDNVFAAAWNDTYVAFGASLDPAGSGPAVSGLVTVFSAKFGTTLANYNVHVGAGYTAMAFMANGGDLGWVREDTGMSVVRVAPEVNSVIMSPTSVIGGNSVNAVVTLISPASGLGTKFAVTSSDTSVATVTSPFTCPANATSFSMPVATYGVDTTKTVTISVKQVGAYRTANLEVTPSDIASITFNPTTVYDNETAVGTVTLNGQAGPSGIVVSLATDSPALSTVPATVTVPAGADHVDFNMANTTVDADTVIKITGTYGATSIDGSYTLAPNYVESVTIPKIYSGASGTGTITLHGPAHAGGSVVTLSSDNPAVTVPATVTVAAGATTATFPVTTTAVAAPVTVTVTAVLNGRSTTGTLDLRQPGVVTLAAAPATVTGGNTSTFTVTLTGNAPAGGLVVNLVSSDTTVGTCPATVTVAAGTKTATFTVTTLVQTANKTLKITASRDGSSVAKSITVTRPR